MLSKGRPTAREAMQKEVPGPMEVMHGLTWGRIPCGVTELRWTTIGFQVHQKLNKYNIKRIETILYGERTTISVGERATSPTFVTTKMPLPKPYPLLMRPLHLTVLRWMRPLHWSMTLSCVATDMSSLNTIIRETYKHLFAENDFLQTSQANRAETESQSLEI